VDYFIDECGQTGDLARLNALSGFSDQPIFVSQPLVFRMSRLSSKGSTNSRKSTASASGSSSPRRGASAQNSRMTS